MINEFHTNSCYLHMFPYKLQFEALTLRAIKYHLEHICFRDMVLHVFYKNACEDLDPKKSLYN
jgi:hypothetical protein